MRALNFDLGKKCGFGLLDTNTKEVRSGSHEILTSWAPLGAALLVLENHLQRLISKHEPDVLGVARPFVRYGRGGKMVDTPQNLVPMFAAFAILNRLAAVANLPLDVIQESDARNLMLGEGNTPRKSAEIKQAINLACKARGWPCCDFEASDALCIGAAVIEGRLPKAAHQTTPLFTASARKSSRRRRAA